MGLFDSIFSFIKSAIGSIKKFFKRFIKGVLSFFNNVVSWFRKLALIPGRDIPFIMEASKLKEMLNTAPEHHCGVFNAVYNEETDSITHHEFVGADKLDSETKSVLNKATEGIVVFQ